MASYDVGEGNAKSLSHSNDGQRKPGRREVESLKHLYEVEVVSAKLLAVRNEWTMMNVMWRSHGRFPLIKADLQRFGEHMKILRSRLQGGGMAGPQPRDGRFYY